MFIWGFSDRPLPQPRQADRVLGQTMCWKSRAGAGFESGGRFSSAPAPELFVGFLCGFSQWRPRSAGHLLSHVQRTQPQAPASAPPTAAFLEDRFGPGLADDPALLPQGMVPNDRLPTSLSARGARCAMPATPTALDASRRAARSPAPPSPGVLLPTCPPGGHSPW